MKKECVSAVDSVFMDAAFEEAKKTFETDDVPVGAVVVKNGEVIASAHNTREYFKDATAHAEINVIRQACDILRTWRLEDCTLYVTLEPCPMCMGAAINSRISRIVFGAKDAKAGACGSLINLASFPFNHKPEIVGNVASEKCSELLRDFFEEKRKYKSNK